MINQQHLIIPPQELIQQWVDEIYGQTECDDARDEHIATQAARWGADQELNECCHLLRLQGFDVVDDLRAARRPKPPSLKKQALGVITNSAICDHLSPQDEAILRRALEALPE